MLDAEGCDQPLALLHQLGLVEGDEVHGEAAAHRLARLRVAEHDAVAVGEAVHRALGAGGELHHEQLGAALGRQQLDGLLEAQRGRAGLLVEQLVRAVDGRVEHAEAARAGAEDGLEADGPVGVAELERCLRHGGAALHAVRLRRRQAEALQQLAGRALVVGPGDRLLAGDHHADALLGEAAARVREPFEVER